MFQEVFGLRDRLMEEGFHIIIRLSKKNVCKAQINEKIGQSTHHGKANLVKLRVHYQ